MVKEARPVEYQNLQLNNSSCPVCRVIAWILQAVPRNFRPDKHKLSLVLSTADNSTFSTPLCSRFGLWRTPSICLALCVWPIDSNQSIIFERVALVTDSQSLLESESATDSSRLQRSISPRSLDYKQIKRWLSTCDSESHSRCRPPNVRLQGPSKLIDCRTLRLVEARPSYDYVALSYVWGQQQHHMQSSDYPKCLLDFPTTIRDAVTVTYELGYQYLWVDRYCIDQNDSTEKHGQIQQMGAIYNTASLTIMAAAGSDAEHGLPGVSKKRESIPPTTTIFGWTINGFPDNPIKTIRDSVWMTRAWTYQEALLSRRRLIFTDQQVYFECQELSREDAYIDNSVSQPSAKCFMYSDEEFGRLPEQILYHIEKYSLRKLTYEDDYLNGFLGILGCLAETNYPTPHLFGVPIFPPVTLNRKTVPLNRVDRSYGWRLMVGMTWEVETGTRRRAQGFPSWSWVGWSGPVTYVTTWIRIEDMNSDCEAWVENAAGELLPLQDLYEPSGSSSLANRSLPTVLHIESEVFEVKVVYLRQELHDAYIIWAKRPRTIRRWKLETGYWVMWEGPGGQLVYTRVRPFEDLGKDPFKEVITQAKNFKILVTGTTFSTYKNGEKNMHGKLLREIRDGYEVVGNVYFGYDRVHVRNLSSETFAEEDVIPNMVRERVRLL